MLDFIRRAMKVEELFEPESNEIREARMLRNMSEKDKKAYRALEDMRDTLKMSGDITTLGETIKILDLMEDIRVSNGYYRPKGSKSKDVSDEEILAAAWDYRNNSSVVIAAPSWSWGKPPEEEEKGCD